MIAARIDRTRPYRVVAALALWCCLATVGSVVWAADPGAPRNVQAVDDPEDNRGTQMIVSWEAPPEVPRPWGMYWAGYQVFYAAIGGEMRPGPVVPLGSTEALVDTLKPWPWRPFEIRVASVHLASPALLVPDETGAIEPSGARFILSDPIGPVQPLALWYDPERTTVLVMMVIYSAIVIITISYARRRAEEMYIRPIAGLQAVDDAIGRATEMGKPILYVSGLSGIGDIATIASMLILGHLSRRTAHYETPILVPCNDPLVMTVEREIVRQAYLEEGKPQAFKPENIYYVTDSQFGYVAAVDGIMVRDRPAACFYMGYFYAEALILAETGNAAGAIQIAGTDADTQLPFFITACDYTLMGEELYAASAYLSRQPLLVAQLRGQDIGKAFIALILLVGAAIATSAVFWPQVAERFLAWFQV
jgi:hypothetical protein